MLRSKRHFTTQQNLKKEEPGASVLNSHKGHDDKNSKKKNSARDTPLEEFDKANLNFFSENTDSLSFDGKKQCPAIRLQYENFLPIEISKLIIEIYQIHMNSDKRQTLKFSEDEQRFKNFTQTLSKDSAVYIIQRLIENIIDYIKLMKTQVFRIPEVKNLLLSIKDTKEESNHQRQDKCKSGTKRGTFLKKCDALSASPKRKSSRLIFDDAPLPNIPRRRSMRNKQSVLTNIYSPFQKDLLAIIGDSPLLSGCIIFNELCSIKSTLIKSAEDIQRVFQSALTHFENYTKINPVSIDGIQREAFNHVFFEDELISNFLSRVQRSSKAFLNERIIYLVSQIEEDSLATTKEMTRVIEALDNLQTEESKLCVKNKKPHAAPGTHTHLPTPSSKKTRPSKPSEDIDELVKFIIADDNKTKKSKKKNKNCKKKKKAEEIVEDEGPRCISQYDHEVELFKKSIEKCSFKAESIQKIHPMLSPEWIENIAIRITMK